MKKTLLITCVLFASLFASAQNSREWSTYFGGVLNDQGFAVTTDAFGNVYLAGFTNDSLGISSGGFQNAFGGGVTDAFLTKFDGSGNRLWTTFYGGTGNDTAYSVKCDINGNVYIAGNTSSPNNIASGGFQTTFGGGATDGFVAVFDSTGNRLWSTYFGGTGTDECFGTAVDDLGNVYLTGLTNSAAGISTTGAFQIAIAGGIDDAYLAKLDYTGALVWSTYMGGLLDDQGRSVGVNSYGDVYVTGWTNSIAGLAVGGHQTVYGGGAFDGFLYRFDSTGTMIWSTYYGGTSQDEGRSVVVTDDHVYISGRTVSTSGISSGGFQAAYGGGSFDAFMVKFDTAGVRQWGTYYGGTGQDAGYYMAKDNMENLYMVGRTGSNAGINSGGFQTTFNGGTDSYLVKFDSAGVRIGGTYVGGNGTDQLFGVAIGDGKIYVAGYTASTTGIASGGFQTTYGGGTNDAFLVKLDSRLILTSTKTDAVCNLSCDGTATVNTNGATGLPLTYLWTGGQTTQTATGLCAGTYEVYVHDANGNNDSTSVTINEPVAIATSTASTNASCSTNDGTAWVTATLGVSPYTYDWPTISQSLDTAYTLGAGVYNVIVTDANGCTATDFAIVNNVNAPVVTLATQMDVTCATGNDGSATMNISGGTLPYTFSWSPTGGTDSIASGLTAGTYMCSVTDSNGCISAQSVTISEPPPLTLTMSGPISICNGQLTTISGSAGGGVLTYNYIWNNGSTLSDSLVANPDATPTASTTYTLVLTDGHGCTMTDSVMVNVVPVPVAQITGGGMVCAGSSITLTASGGDTFLWNTGDTTASITVSPLIPTTYTVTVTNGGLCTDNTTANIGVNPLPGVSLISSPASCSSCADGSAAAFGSGNPPLTYDWSNSATTQIISGLTPGYYTVCVMDGNGCMFCDSVNVDFTVGVSSKPFSVNDISIYPHPFSSQANIHITGLDMNHVELNVFDLLGQQIEMNIIRNGNEFIINRGNINSGIYFLHIISEGKIVGVKKIAVNN